MKLFADSSTPLLLILLLITFLATSSNAASFRDGKSSKSSVFSLFNLKGKSKFWSESVIRTDFGDLESSVSKDNGKMEVANYTKSGNIANYLKLSEVDSIYLPVPVNFIFIGFDGKGNHDFKLGREEMERWFTNIDHVFQHTRVPPIGEILTPFYKISIENVQRHHLPFVSHINYNFSVHTIQMGEKVTSVFEHAIRALSRKENVSEARFQISDFGEYLRLMSRQKWTRFKTLITNQAAKSRILEKISDFYFGENEDIIWQVDVDRMEYIFATLVSYFQIENAYNIFVLNPKRNNTRARYGYRRGLSESEINYLRMNKTIQANLLKSEKVAGVSLEIDKGDPRPLHVNRPAASFSWTTTDEIDTIEWSKKCLDALETVEKVNEGKENTELAYNKAVQILHGKDDLKQVLEKGLKSGDLSGLHSECITDTWIGRDRWAFIDLSAGPFSWGPSVGGEGVRTDISLPNVGKTVGAVAEISEEEAEDRLQDAIRERFSSFGDDHQAIDILLAEVDIYELFAFKHCKGRRTKLALCEELDERMRDLKGELEGYNREESDENHKRLALDTLKRMEKWNLFSDTPEEFQSYTVARDSFLAHLGATLWGSLRHVIAPSMADGAYHYYEKISFQLYFITQEKIRNIKLLPINLRAFTDALSTLVLSPQTVMFSQHLMSLSDDPELTMAFSVSRRAAAVPLLLVNGTYRSTVRAYLDSSILQSQLQKLSEHGSLKGSHSSSRSTLEVPIFWFFHSDPLFVDKHYQAKALSDMIIVVQSESAIWESHLQCNGRSSLWDLRNPLKPAIAATAEHLAGLLPLHLIYSHAHESAIEDWTWSVGCNPMSITSQGWHLSKFQLDAMARSYIVTSLEESVLAINAAINRLVLERTTSQSFKLFKSQERGIVEKYNSIISLWKRISTISSGLRYGDAMNLLPLLEDASNGFTDQINSTLFALHPIHCTRERKVGVEFDLTTIPAFMVVSAILWFVLKPRRAKPKIN